MNTTFFVLLLLGGAWLSFLIVEPFLSYIVGALLLTFVFYPLYRNILEGVRYPALASIIVILVVFLIVVVPVFFAVWSLASDVAEIARDLDADDVQGYLERIDHRIAALTGFEILLPANETGPGAGGGNTTGEGGGTDPGNGTANATGSGAGHDLGNGTGSASGTGNGTAGGEGRRGLLQPGDVTRFVVPQIEALLTKVVRESIGFVFQATLGVFVMLFIMYYGFKDGDRFVDAIRRTLPLRDEYKSALFEQVRDVVDAVFIGQILVSLVQGALGGIGFWIFGVPNPFFWGFVMTLLAILPIVGTPLVFVPASLWLMLTGDTISGLFLLIYGVTIVSTIDNILKPKVIGDRAEIHPAIVLLGVVGGIAYFGFIGFLLGPLIIGIFAVLLEMFSQDFVAREEAHVPALAVQNAKMIPAVNVVYGREVGAHGPDGFGNAAFAGSTMREPHLRTDPGTTTADAGDRDDGGEAAHEDADGARGADPTDPDKDDARPTRADDGHDASV